MRARLRSGSGAPTGSTRVGDLREREWVEAAAIERAEAARAEPRRGVALVVSAAALAALLAAVFPLTPGFSRSDTVVATVVAAVTAAVAVACVALAERLGRHLPRAGAGDRLVYTAALASTGAATIHLAVAKAHFEEYFLFGLFFVASAIAQLVWPIWLLLRRWPPLLALAAAGNALIVALWGVDRIWGLPLGPTPWKPDPVGFGDSVTSALELLVAVACIALLVRGQGGALRRLPLLALTSLTVVLTTLSLLSVIGVDSSLLTPTQ